MLATQPFRVYALLQVSRFAQTMKSIYDHNTLKEYFASIERRFKETRASKNKTYLLDVVLGISIFLLVFSVIPLVPYVLSRAAPWVTGGTTASLFSLQIPLSSFWMWWLTSVAGMVAWVTIIGRLPGQREEKRKKNWLSEPQMRFCYCYAIIDEIRKYRTNLLGAHIDRSIELWPGLMDSVGSLFITPRIYILNQIHAPTTSIDEHRGTYGVSGGMGLTTLLEIDQLKRRFSWFRLDRQTETITKAFSALQIKLEDRLGDKKDLLLVQDCLTRLAGYFYSNIPELSAAGEEDDGKALTSFGENDLILFSEQVNALSVYSSESKIETGSTSPQRKVASSISRLAALFSHPNVLVCFLVWYLLSGLLLLLTLSMAFYFLPTQNMDSVLLSTLIGVPPASAVAAVAVSRRQRREHAN